MSWRRLLAAGASVLALGGCSKFGSHRHTPREEGIAIAPVFETAVPYSTRKVSSGDIARFLAKYPDYRPDSAAVADFYASRDMQFAWILDDSLSSSAEAFIAYSSGGNPKASKQATAFHAHIDEIYEQSATGKGSRICDDCAIDVELQLTAEFSHFADRNYGGNLSRDSRDLNWFIPRARKDPARLIDSLAAGKMDLEAYEPIHPQYQLLVKSMQRYKSIESAPWPVLALPAGTKKLASKDSAVVIGEIRHRLHLLGDLADSSSSERYDSAMVTAVKIYQGRHGLATDGVIGDAAIKSLNVPIADRLRTMLVNIERLRWVPEQEAPNRLVVNIPEFRLHIYEGGREVQAMDVVVGKAATHTVIFSDTMTQIVFSPSWSVPESIVQNELVPAMRRTRGYLAKHEMDVVGGSPGHPAIRQRPGPANPLGGAKFLFPNSFDIYMHDTPSRALFEKASRAGSHGCVRLARAADFAAYLLRDDPSWTPERIHAAMTSGKEMPVNLKEVRPVTIGYFTSWVDADGLLNFRDDVYGHDAKLASELFTP